MRKRTESSARGTRPFLLRSVNALLRSSFVLAAFSFEATAQAAAILEAYPTETSLAQGDTLELHVNSRASTYTLSIWRQGRGLDHVADAGSFVGHVYPIPAQPWETDCAWPVSCRVPVSSSWRPGAYLARLDVGGSAARIPFVVRARVHGSAGPILVQLSINTWQAYNPWGGKNLYKAYGSGLTGRAYRVTFHRPYYSSGVDGSGQFFLWEAPFISWLESEGYAYEVCTNVDLHREPGQLDAYRVFVSVGHDEYYSREMYDELERYVNVGGNLAFFSGNALWWQVRFENQEHTMVCYKDKLLDPMTGVDDSRVTVNWHAAPVLRPPARLMGIYYNGSSGIPTGAYQVFNPRHWAFQGVAVDSGQTFGYPMVGYEVDARASQSPPVDVIARTELPDLDNGGVMRPAEAVYYERTPAYGFPQGRGGKVFAGGTINFVGALHDGYNAWMKVVGQPDPIARAIGVNVLDRMACTLASPRLASPSEGQTVNGSQVFLQWYASTAQRPGVPVRYQVFWQTAGGRVDSVDTPNLSALAAVLPDTSYRWWVRGQSACGVTAQSAAVAFRTRMPTDLVGARRPLLSLSREPGHLRILVTPESSSQGTVDVFDVAGQRVRSFGSRRFGPDTTKIDWNLRDEGGFPVPSGLYLVQARVGSRSARQKIVILH